MLFRSSRGTRGRGCPASCLSGSAVRSVQGAAPQGPIAVGQAAPGCTTASGASTAPYALLLEGGDKAMRLEASGVAQSPWSSLGRRRAAGSARLHHGGAVLVAVARQACSRGACLVPPRWPSDRSGGVPPGRWGENVAPSRQLSAPRSRGTHGSGCPASVSAAPPSRAPIGILSRTRRGGAGSARLHHRERSVTSALRPCAPGWARGHAPRSSQGLSGPREPSTASPCGGERLAASRRPVVASGAKQACSREVLPCPASLFVQGVGRYTSVSS